MDKRRCIFKIKKNKIKELAELAITQQTKLIKDLLK
jgi:hypothetical protein